VNKSGIRRRRQFSFIRRHWPCCIPLYKSIVLAYRMPNVDWRVYIGIFYA